jgi:hypothetical protein
MRTGAETLFPPEEAMILAYSVPVRAQNSEVLPE